MIESRGKFLTELGDCWRRLVWSCGDDQREEKSGVEVGGLCLYTFSWRVT
jgi:hypothetical protein